LKTFVEKEKEGENKTVNDNPRQIVHWGVGLHNKGVCAILKRFCQII